MSKLIKSVLIYKRMKKPICRGCDSDWQSTYATVVNRQILISCHESHTKCGVRFKIILNAPAFIFGIYKAQSKNNTN